MVYPVTIADPDQTASVVFKQVMQYLSTTVFNPHLLYLYACLCKLLHKCSNKKYFFVHV